MSLGALAFLNPWLLLGLASLPLIYWLLRTVPPRPRQIAFPATRILVGIEGPEQTPAKTPWWLLLIRLLAAALVILALAEPILNPTREGALKGTGPVVVAVDNGWAAAARWGERTALIERLITQAEAQNRPVVLLATAGAAKTPTARIEAPADARTTAAALLPQPFAPRRKTALAALETLLQSNSGDPAIVWLTDGIDHDAEAADFAAALSRLSGGGTFSVVGEAPGGEALGVIATVGEEGRLGAKVLRAGGSAREGLAHALSAQGQRLAEAPFRFAAPDATAEAKFDLPLEIRNQVARVEIAGERSAGAVSLLDARSQWQRVGLVAGSDQEQAQPLLSPLYYIEKALRPYAELVQPADANLAAGIHALFEQGVTVLLLADVGTLSGEVKTRVAEWVEKGGILVRFAGPRLEKGGDDLMPVALRLGGRTLGGALSWSTPQPLGAFEEASLFAGLAVPPDIAVNRQVLADPARLGPDVAIWARLKDGTPLVTAQRRGEGQLVLFHVTANSDWSNLPLSGLFVEMLRRISSLGALGGIGGTAKAGAEGGEQPAQADALAPLQTLDGFGALGPPPPTAEAIPAASITTAEPELDHPPGYYGPAGTPRTLNVIGPKSVLAALPPLPAGTDRRAYESATSTPLRPWLLAAALMLLFLDIAAVLLLQMGGVRLRDLDQLGRRAGQSAGAILAVALLAAAAADGARAQDTVPATPQAAPAQDGGLSPQDAIAQKATAKVTFGYVLTGNAEADQKSRLGLMGLGKVLAVRTAVEPGEPIGVDIIKDEIAFYPVLYWPVVPDAPTLPEATLAKIDAYMKQGGMIVFDTRDFGSGLPSGVPLGGQGGNALQRLVGSLDLPRLEPVPDDHVLTKSFYLLHSFPGRWDGGQMWVEADAPTAAEDGRQARRADGVTSILITSNDFASAWALDDRFRPLYPVVPGGESQREMSFRTGINIVMHALTGNYKADQVHVPALLERLGQ